MPALARRFRVVGPDARGHGGTDNPADRLGYDQMADDLAGLVGPDARSVRFFARFGLRC